MAERKEKPKEERKVPYLDLFRENRAVKRYTRAQAKRHRGEIKPQQVESPPVVQEPPVVREGDIQQIVEAPIIREAPKPAERVPVAPEAPKVGPQMPPIAPQPEQAVVGKPEEGVPEVLAGEVDITGFTSPAGPPEKLEPRLLSELRNMDKLAGEINADIGESLRPARKIEAMMGELAETEKEIETAETAVPENLPKAA